MVRGRVLDTDGQPLGGATVEVLNAPQYGSTLSQATGEYDLALSGGGAVTLRFSLSGRLPAQRTVNTPFNNYAFAEDVVLVPRVSQSTVVNLNSGLQVARGPVETDQDGSRQSTLIFPAGATAQVVLPDGSTQAISGLTLYQTEYTVGSLVAESTPANLPEASAPTLCYEFTVQEAESLGGVETRLSQPIFHYNENFLSLPVGTRVPSGSFDQRTATWIPSDDGRVIGILGVDSGVASIDADGDGAPDSSAALTALGFTLGELEQLAQLYSPGKSLWRVPLSHLSTWDFNFNDGPPNDAVPPQPLDRSDEERRCSCRDCDEGSPADQMSKHHQLLPGSAYNLHYSSDRSPGRKGQRTVAARLSGASVPASLREIKVELEVAGQRIVQSYPPGANFEWRHLWDGKDAYGRTVQGMVQARYRVSYVYPTFYRQPGATQPRSFGLFANQPLTGSVRTGLSFPIQTGWFPVMLGSYDVRSIGLGGFSLDPVHFYSPNQKAVYLGTGGVQGVDGLGLVLSRIAGGGSLAPGSISARDARLNFSRIYNIAGLAVGKDGSLFVGDLSHRIFRVDRSGQMTLVAGTSAGYSGDGGPATSARLLYPGRMAVGPDGSLYFLDNGGGTTAWSMVRRIAPDGTISTVAGTPTRGFSGDGGPATAAQLGASDLDVDAQGNLYLADAANWRIRKVSTDGIVTTIAGTGFVGGSLADGVPGSQAQIRYPTSLCLAPDGSLLFSSQHKIRRLRTDGIVETVAGIGTDGDTGDGDSALLARLSSPNALAVADGRILFAQDAPPNATGDTAMVLRAIESDGRITRVAGVDNGIITDTSDEGNLAIKSEIGTIYAVETGHDGKVYFNSASTAMSVVWALQQPMPGFGLSDHLIPSRDGSELWRFSGSGRHLETYSALTGALGSSFGYDSQGWLSFVTDSDGNTTLIERDSNGHPSAIVGPFGQRTVLTTNADGYVTAVTSPGGRVTRMSFTSDGLLQSVTDPNGNPSTMEYSANGLLFRSLDPTGNGVTMSRQLLEDGFETTFTTSMGRVSKVRIVHGVNDDTVEISTA
ncbi:hypothetical protein DYH09_10825, partial [bacterium CPR1]|nr:hypothetical protein [bacterium CPR1]